MRAVRLSAVGVTAALAIAVLSGCGTESPTAETANAPSATATPSAAPSPSDNGVVALPPAQILAKAKQALGAAESFRYAGRIHEVDEEGSADMSIDLTLAKGTGAQGWLGWSKGKLQVASTPAATFMQGDAAFFTENIFAAAAKKFSGKWLAMTPDQLQQDLLLPAFITLDGVLGMFEESDASQATKSTAAIINGIPAIGLAGVGESTTVLWVATTGEPYPLRFEGKAKGSNTLIDFTQFNEAAGITLPPAGATIPYPMAELAEMSE